MQHPPLLPSSIKEGANATAHPLRVDGAEYQQEDQEEGAVNLEYYVAWKFGGPWQASLVRDYRFHTFLHVKTPNSASDQRSDHPGTSDFQVQIVVPSLKEEKVRRVRKKYIMLFFAHRIFCPTCFFSSYFIFKLMGGDRRSQD